MCVLSNVVCCSKNDRKCWNADSWSEIPSHFSAFLVSEETEGEADFAEKSAGGDDMFSTDDVRSNSTGSEVCETADETGRKTEILSEEDPALTASMRLRSEVTAMMVD